MESESYFKLSSYVFCFSFFENHLWRTPGDLPNSSLWYDWKHQDQGHTPHRVREMKSDLKYPQCQPSAAKDENNPSRIKQKTIKPKLIKLLNIISYAIWKVFYEFKLKLELQFKHHHDLQLKNTIQDHADLAGHVAWADMIIPTITPNSPSALPKISITRILTKSVEFWASDNAQLLPIIPTHNLHPQKREDENALDAKSYSISQEIYARNAGNIPTD